MTFDDGGTLTGSFVYDPNIPCVILTCWNSGAFSALSIVTSPVGTGFFQNGFSYSTGNLTNITFDEMIGAVNGALLQLQFTQSLNNGGVIPLGYTVEFSGAGSSRRVVSGSVVGTPSATPTPTPAPTPGPTVTPTPTPAPALLPIRDCPHCPGRLRPKSGSLGVVKLSGEIDLSAAPSNFRVEVSDSAGVEFAADAVGLVCRGPLSCIARDKNAGIAGGISKLKLRYNPISGLWRFRLRGYGDLSGVSDPLVTVAVLVDGQTFATTDIWDERKTRLQIDRIGH